MIVVLLLAALTGSYCIGTPFSAGFRDCQTAMIARNVWHDGWSGMLLPRIDFHGDQPGYMVQEFPLYAGIVAALYALFGLHDWLGQVVSLAAALGSVAFLYGIVRRLDGPRTAFAAGVLMALTPMQQIIGQSHLPDTVMMLLLPASLYAMTRYALDGAGGWLALATACEAGAVLVKGPAGLVLLLPLGFLAWTRHGWPMMRKPAVWLAVAVALATNWLWLKHADRINAIYFPPFVSTSEFSIQWFLGPLAMRWDWHFYARLAGRFFVYFSPVIALAAFVALFRRPTEPRRWLFHIWFAANVVYMLVCANLFFAHKHYQVVFVPVAAALAARVAVASWARWRAMAVAAVVLLLAWDAGLGFRIWREQRDPLTERGAAALRDVSQPQDLVLVAAFHTANGRTSNLWNVPNWLYMAHRRGWQAPLYEQFGLATVDEYRRKGARWLLMELATAPESSEAYQVGRGEAGWPRLLRLSGMAPEPTPQPDDRLLKLAAELRARYRQVREGGGFVVFDLRGPL